MTGGAMNSFSQKLIAIGAMLLIPTFSSADPPTAKSNDVDALLKDAKPATPAKPATLPTGSANSPLKNNAEGEDVRRRAVMTLSNGEKIKGRFSTTYEQPIRVFDPERKEYRDIPFKLIKSLEAKVIWERDEKEWHFKESGSDIKEYSGKTYPARETTYTFTLANSQSISGSVAAPLYLEKDKGSTAFILHKRDKGEVGQTLKQLIYVMRVDFEE